MNGTSNGDALAALIEPPTAALAYLQAGYAVHFCGPAGTGKTMASCMGRNARRL
jgi:hypothetical protein